MQIKHIVIVLGLAAIGLPLAVLASQPPTRLDELRPSLETAQVLSLLVLDPYAETRLEVTLPRHFTTLDADADPFAGPAAF